MNLTNKEKYRQFCKENKNVPIFLKDFWLDVVCYKKWDACIYEKWWKIFAVMPFYKQKRWIFKILTMPKLTQFLWPYILYSDNQKYYKKISWEKKVMESLVNQLPKNNYFINNFSSKITNLLPFYWNNFEIKIRYTYKIFKDNKIEELEKQFETDIRRRIKKCKEFWIKIIESNDIEKFFDLNKLTFKRQWKKIPYDFEFVKNIFETCKKNNSWKLLLAYTVDNKVIAWGYFVFDNNNVYYLMWWIDPDYKNLWAMDLLIYNWIKFALENWKNFDFEWSMVESIEKYFRSFWSRQVMYYQVEKNNLPILNPEFKLKTMKFLKNLLKL